ncbi:hypothetical protein LUZ60_007565 [Juncus effusus]|nr:hypothetical protein LUZ60_007565 [Juncus effusus]
MFSARTHLNSSDFYTNSFVKVRKKSCFSCGYSFPLEVPFNFIKLKLHERKRSSVCTPKCLNSVSGDKKGEIEETENQTDQNSKISKKGRVDCKALALTLHNAKKPEEISELLKDYPDLPIPVYSTLIRGLGMDKKLDAAFALFNWMKENEKSPNQVIYNSLLTAIRLSKNYYKINSVIPDMKSEGIKPSIVTYNILMNIYIDQGKSHEVFDLISEIKLNGLIPSPATYSTILLAYKELNDANGALEFFIKLREKYQNGEFQNNINNSEENYNWDHEFQKIEKSTLRIFQIILRKWISNDENGTINVLKFINNLDKYNIKPNGQFYEGLVWACTKEEHYTIIKELYKRIRENTINQTEISLSVCNHAIFLLGKSKKWWAALEIFEEMLDKGPKPNNLSFNLVISNFGVLLNAARKRGLWKWALQLLDKMHEKGLPLGKKEFNAVLIACSKAGETVVAVKVFGQMVDRGVKPEIHSYIALLSSLEKGKFYDKALHVWSHMCKVGVKPNLYACTILASIYAQKGEFDKVDEVIHEMELEKIGPSVVTFNAIISCCAKSRMGLVALDWFEKMKGKNVKPNEISYEMLIQALVKEGKSKLACQVYIEAISKGFRLGDKTCELVRDAARVCGFKGGLDELGFWDDEKRKVGKKVVM